MTTFERVRLVLDNELGAVPIDEITEETRIVADLSADSLDIVETIMAVEEEFGIEITDEQAEEVVTVGDLVRLVDSFE